MKPTETKHTPSQWPKTPEAYHALFNAAPDLLAALELILDMLGEESTQSEFSPVSLSIKTAQAAIARAKSQ